MTEHPAQAFKYQIVNFTRGNGVEIGGGALYPHFKPAYQGMAELDFVFVPNGDDWLTSLDDHRKTIREAGCLVRITKGELEVFQRCGDVMTPLNLTIPKKSVCVVRYGGFGDSIQASSILPELKRQGYTVYFMTTPTGYEILKHDPHIDEWLMQDNEQLTNEELPELWADTATRFDRLINLSESIEGTLLAFPGRANHAWPLEVRQLEMDKNYLEWTAQLALLPYHSESRFYPSDDERTEAAGYLRSLRRECRGDASVGKAPRTFNLLWCLSGSSMHKFYPHQDEVITRILAEMPAAVVILTGETNCKILESGWEDVERVRCRSGEIGIRQSLALAQQADCVVGPETGVLNAVAFESNGKVIMLSHSSANNLTKHWSNTATLEPVNTACYPCHRLHFGKTYCHEDKATGAALCQKNIAPTAVFDAIRAHYNEWLSAENSGHFHDA